MHIPIEMIFRGTSNIPEPQPCFAAQERWSQQSWAREHCQGAPEKPSLLATQMTLKWSIRKQKCISYPMILSEFPTIGLKAQEPIGESPTGSQIYPMLQYVSSFLWTGENDQRRESRWSNLLFEKKMSLQAAVIWSAAPLNTWIL